MWPDFDETDLEAAVVEFRRRDRRFGGVPAANAETAAMAAELSGAALRTP
jgi:undecaprenyl diphosphate synthase